MFECIQFKFVFHCTLDVYFVVKLIFLFMVQPRIMELIRNLNTWMIISCGALIDLV